MFLFSSRMSRQAKTSAYVFQKYMPVGFLVNNNNNIKKKDELDNLAGKFNEIETLIVRTLN